MADTKFTPEWKDNIENDYKIKGKFSNNADLIRRVISKCDREAVTPLLSQLAEKDRVINSLRDEVEYLQECLRTYKS